MGLGIDVQDPHGDPMTIPEVQALNRSLIEVREDRDHANELLAKAYRQLEADGAMRGESPLLDAIHAHLGY
jgi:hypothetical protein